MHVKLGVKNIFFSLDSKYDRITKPRVQLLSFIVELDPKYESFCSGLEPKRKDFSLIYFT